MPTIDVDVPWKQRFRAALLSNASPAKANPTRGLVACNYETPAIQLYAWDVHSGNLRRVIDRPGATWEGWIAPDGSYIYFLDDADGSEMGHLTRVPFESGSAEDVTPGLPPYTLRGVGFSRSGNMLALNPINADGFQLVVVPLGPGGELGQPRLIYRNPQETWGADLSADGTLAAMITTERAGGLRHYSLLAIETATGERIAELWDGPQASVTAAIFSPLVGDPRVLAATTRTGFTRPLIWNPRTGERIDLALDDLPGEVFALDWSGDGAQLLLCQIHRASQRLYTYTLATGTLTRLEHPEGTCFAEGFSESHFGPAGEVFAIWEDSTHPPEVLALDSYTGALKRSLLAISEVPPGHAWQSVTFTASDGQEVQGWLARPDGTGPFPAIVVVHGGPHLAMPNTYSPESQAWLDHGFAFLSINYRGSTTFGRAFKEQIWGDIGHWEMEDIVAGRAWLVEQGIARPEAIFLHGGSYGGFLTLLGLGRYPDLWAGGLALVAIADWALNYADASDALKGAFRAWFRGSPEEHPDRYRASSPITYAAQVRAPLLVIQGRNDSRTTARQMERYEATMRALGKTIEVDWFDAGHGIQSDDEAIQFQERLLAFARRVLDGLS